MSHLPPPATISVEAQQILLSSAANPVAPNPAPDDEAGWRALGEFASTPDPGMSYALALATTGAVPDESTVTVEARTLGSASFFVAEPEGLDPDDDRVLFAVHGGAFTFGGGESARVSTGLLAANYGVRTWGMDYRQLPDHPFPAGLDDCTEVYRALVETVEKSSVTVIGQSGGANLVAALLLRASAAGLPLPAAAALISPPVDLTCQGDSYHTNAAGVEGVAIENVFARYAGSHDLRDPLISPLLATIPGDFPPTILTAGTRDFLLSDTVRFHRALLAAGIRAELHVWEGAPHGMFMGRAPEDREQVAQIRRFFESVRESDA